MKLYGNLMNRISEDSLSPAPTVGMGATIYLWSDRYPATVTKVSTSGKTVTLTEDHAERTDKNGLSESQTYEFSPNPSGRVWTARKTKRGTWRAGGNGVTFGSRAAYRDPSF